MDFNEIKKLALEVFIYQNGDDFPVDEAEGIVSDFTDTEIFYLSLKHPKSVGDRIRKLRKEHKLSQKEVAIKTNLSEQTIANYEKGKYLPPLENAEAIAKIFSVSGYSLLGQTDEELIKQIGYSTVTSINNTIEYAETFNLFDSDEITGKTWLRNNIIKQVEVLSVEQLYEVQDYITYLQNKQLAKQIKLDY